MTSIKIKFRPSSIEGKTGRIYFQVIHQRKTKVHKSSYKVYPTEWSNETSSFVIADGNNSRATLLNEYQGSLNNDIVKLQECIDLLIKRDRPFTANDVIRLYENKTHAQTLETYMITLIDNLKEQGRIRTSETYQCALDCFLKFRKNKDIYFDDITQEVMERYESYLKQKGICMNSSSFYMRILRAVYNRAVENGLTLQRHPFRHVYTGIEKTSKRAVQKHIIKNIKEVPLRNGCSMDFARDMFMFSFYTRGMSFVDMAYLRKKDLKNGILTYRRKKTGQQLSIRWEKCMQEIINKYPSTHTTEYILPIIKKANQNERQQYRNAMILINRRLKKISSLVNSPLPLSMYVARHSWASIAKSKRIPLSVISEGMGHESENTTKIYLATLDTSVVDRANHLIIKDI